MNSDSGTIFSSNSISEVKEGVCSIEQLSQLNFSTSSEELSPKARTPSGNVLTQSVKQISKIFAEGQMKKKAGGKLKSVNSQQAQIKRKLSKKAEQKLRVKAERIAVKREQFVNTSGVNHVKLDHDQTSDSVNERLIKNFDLLGSDEDEDTGYFTPPLPKEELQLSHFKEFHKALPTSKHLAVINMGDNQEQSKQLGEDALKQGAFDDEVSGINQPHDDAPLDSNENLSRMEVDRHSTAEDQAHLMNAQTVHEMFKQIKDDFLSLQKKVDTQQKPDFTKEILDRCKAEIVEAVEQAVSKRSKEEEEEIQKLKDDLRHFKYKTRALTNVVDLMSTEIDDLKTRMEACELNSSKRGVSITGLELPKKKLDAIHYLESFFSSNLGIAVQVEEYFKLGSSDSNNIVVLLQSIREKQLIMQLKKKLKDYRSARNNKVFINDYTPLIHQERSFRQNQILKDIEESDAKFKVDFKKGKMFIQGETYKQKVTPPTPKDIVDNTPQELDKILKMTLSQHGKVTQDKSIFEGFTAAVSNHKQIRQLYVKVKMMQPAARHIVCAYFLPGPEKHYNLDYCDDGEYGAGRHLMEYLSQNNLCNRVVFVSRKYGGVRMGADRFVCYRAAAELAIEADKWNSVAQVKQAITCKAKDMLAKPIRFIRRKELSVESGVKNDNTTALKRPATSPPNSDPTQIGKRPNLWKGSGSGRGRGSWGRGRGRSYQADYNQTPGEDWSDQDPGAFDPLPPQDDVE